jgi:VCBS repeat-containing protein
MMKKRYISIILLIIMALPIMMNFNTSADDTNLAVGKSYEITLEAPVENAYPNLAIKDTNKILTDGKIAPASASYNDQAYLHVYRGVYATVEIDMEKTVYIKGFSAGFFANTGHGVIIPREVIFRISKDGQNWFTVSEDKDNNRNAGGKVGREEISYSGNDYYEARYARIIFSSDVHTYIDEVEVYGTQETVSSKPYEYDEVKEYPDAFASNRNPAVGGISNLVLMYSNEYYQNEPRDIGHNTYDDLLPYAAYVDRDKNILDTMFDSFLFLPLSPGDNATYTLKKQTGWEAFLDNAIGEGRDINLTALNRLAGDIKDTLELDDSYKINVFIAVPYPGFLQNQVFGKLDGNTNVSSDSLENMLKIVKWYVDLTIDKFGRQNFEHLNLTGFYWHSEVVTFGTYEPDLIKGYNEYVHSKGYGSIWIPYYCSPGAHMWQELGFDVACLQAGYAFARSTESANELGHQKPGNVNDAMSFAKKYGLGVEIEISGGALDRYSAYIETGAKLGCMQNGVTMFYQDGGPGVFYNTCFNSANRHIYDTTYKYIKAKYEIHPPALDFDGVILIGKNAKNSHGTFNVSDPDTQKSRIKISNLTEPEHGKLAVDGDGFFVYEPDKDFVGEDSFSFSLTDGINTSETYTINILVVDTLFNFTLVNTTLKDSKTCLYTEGETTGTPGDGSLKVFEVVVNKENVVVSASYTSNSAIPENGFVLSAAGVKAEELEGRVKAGDKVILDKVTKAVYFTEPEPSENSEEISAENSSPSGKGGAKKTVLWIAAIAAVLIAGVTAVIIIKKPKKINKE